MQPTTSHNDPIKLKEAIEHDVKIVIDWFNINEMICSAEKTKVLFVGTSANRRSKINQNNVSMDITIGDEIIKESSSERLLGLILNNTLTWKNYLYGNEDYEGLLKQLSKRVGILKKIRKFMPADKFKTVISGLFTKDVDGKFIRIDTDKYSNERIVTKE